jgi:hypothetical protein
VIAEAETCEARGDYAGARTLYEAVLERDNLAEAVYRRLMVCQRELGDAAGAMLTYRRCRELLSIVLGRAPAAETEAVRRSLRRQLDRRQSPVRHPSVARQRAARIVAVGARGVRLPAADPPLFPVISSPLHGLRDARAPPSLINASVSLAQDAARHHAIRRTKTVPKESPWKALSKPIPSATCPRWRRSACPPSAGRRSPGRRSRSATRRTARRRANAVALAIHRRARCCARRLRVTVPGARARRRRALRGHASLRPESTLWIPAEPCAGWGELARMLDDRLPQRSRLLMRKAMGRAAGPLDLTPIAHTFAIDAYAAALAEGAGSAFPRRWIAHAFGAYARVVTLAEADPDALAAQAHLAEVVGATLPPSYALADADVRAVVERHRGDARRRARARAPRRRAARALPARVPGRMAPRTDGELARLMLRELGDTHSCPRSKRSPRDAGA